MQSIFYKMGQQQAMTELGLLKDAQNPVALGSRPAGAPKPPPPPKTPPPKAAPIMGGKSNQAKTLRGEGVFGV